MKHKAREVKRLHRQAMELADEADILLLERNRDEFLHYTRLAFEKEAAAAELMLDEWDIEPTRSVLHRSAATLAYRCEMYVEAERLVYRAKGGYPPANIVAQLDDLLGKVKFAMAGIELGDHKIQFGLQGKEVGFGTASTRELNPRITAFEDLVRQTIRCRNRAENFSPDIVDMAEGYNIYQGETQAASFIVHLTLGRPRESMLPGFVDFDQLVAPLMQNLGLLQDRHLDSLKDQFDDPADYASFVNTAKSLAPDGDRISSVNLQARIGEKVERLFFKRSKSELRTVPLPDLHEGEVFEATFDDIVRKGFLKLADDRDPPICVLVTANRENWNIEGPEDVIELIGRSHWRSKVEVKGRDASKSPTHKYIQVDNASDVREIPSSRNQFAIPF